MNTLLEIISTLATPVYIALLVLAFVSSLVSGYVKRHELALGQASARGAFVKALLQIRVYLANQDDPTGRDEIPMGADRLSKTA